MTDKKRIIWIDSLKGFAIILIVLGHTIGYSRELSGLSRYLSSFYVPLFFLVSGYLFINKPKESLGKFTLKKAKRILIPYFTFALLSLIPFFIFGSEVQSVLGSSRDIDNGIIKSILNVFYASGHSGGLSQNSPLWFLPCYFTVTVLGKLSYTLVEKTKIKRKNLFLAFFFLIIGYIVYKFFNYAYPFCLETALIMLFFYFIGSSLRSVKLNSKKITLLVAAICITLGFILQMYNGRISCMNNDYKNSFIIFLLSALCSTTGFTFLFQLFNKGKILPYLGIHTIPILVFHKMPLIVFQSKIKFTSSYLKRGTVIQELSMAFVVVVLVIISSLILYKCISRFLPVLYGEDKKRA